MDLNTLLSLTMQQITRFMVAEYSTLFLYDEDKNMLWSRIKQPHDADSTSIHLLDNAFSQQWIRADRGITGVVMRKGKSIICNDIHQDNRFDPMTDSNPAHPTHNLLCVPLFDPRKYQIGVVQVINKRTGDFTSADENLLNALCFQIAISIENARLYEHVNKLRHNEGELSGTLQKQNEQLSSAYKQLVESNEQLKSALRKVKINRNIYIVFTLLFLLFMAFFLGFKEPLINRFVEDDMQTPTTPYQFETVEPRYMRTKILLSGYIAPLNVHQVISPFNAKIQQAYIKAHQKVTKGQLLLELDTTEEEIRAQNAKSNYIKAQNHLSQLENWENSSEVINAKRRLQQLKLEKTHLSTKERENKRLLDMGIIAKTEYRASLQDLKNHELEQQTAEQSLLKIQAKGRGQNLKIAQLELNNARLQLDAIQQRLQNAKITAPVAGVIMPLKNANNHATAIVIGKKINQGDSLFSIANLEGIAVETQVDEVDISRIKIGQTVLISGEAFPDLTLKGVVDDISAQADNEYGKVPFFKVRVVAKHLSELQHQHLKLGMSATLEVITYENANALLLPLAAVYQQDGLWMVKRRDKQGYLHPQVVSLGVSNETSVEILHGLDHGDQVYIP